MPNYNHSGSTPPEETRRIRPEPLEQANLTDRGKTHIATLPQTNGEAQS